MASHSLFPVHGAWPSSALGGHFLPTLGPEFYLHRSFLWFLVLGVLMMSSWYLGISKAHFKDEKASNCVCHPFLQLPLEMSFLHL